MIPRLTDATLRRVVQDELFIRFVVFCTKLDSLWEDRRYFAKMTTRWGKADGLSGVLADCDMTNLHGKPVVSGAVCGL
jgi:hypothetical protein